MCLLALSVVAVFPGASSASAQRGASAGDRQSGLMAALTAGVRIASEVTLQGGALPSSLLDVCPPDARRGYRAAVGGGLGGTLSKGPLTLGARGTALTAPIAEFPCPRERASGIHEDREPAFNPGDHAAAEVELRLALPFAERWHLYGAGGRIWPQEVSYVSVGLGVRRSLAAVQRHLVLDVGWTGYRIPIRVLVREWSGNSPVQELSSERVTERQDGLRARIGIEFPIP